MLFVYSSLSSQVHSTFEGVVSADFSTWYTEWIFFVWLSDSNCVYMDNIAIEIIVIEDCRSTIYMESG